MLTPAYLLFCWWLWWWWLLPLVLVLLMLLLLGAVMLLLLHVLVLVLGWYSVGVVGGEEVGVEEEAGEEAVGHTIRSIDSGERVPSVE